MPLPYVTEKQAKETKDKIKELNERIDVIEGGGGSGSGMFTVAINLDELSEEATPSNPMVLPTSMADSEKFWELLKYNSRMGTSAATDLMTGYLVNDIIRFLLPTYFLGISEVFDETYHMEDGYGEWLELFSDNTFTLKYMIEDYNNPDFNQKFIYFFDGGR